MYSERFLGLDFTVGERRDVINELTADVKKLRKRILVTPNVDFLQRFMDGGEPAFVEVMCSADYVINDSRILRLLAFLRGVRLGCYPGSDLVVDLINRRALNGKSVCVVGGGEEIRQVKGLGDLAGFKLIVPPMGFVTNERELDRVIEVVSDASYDYVFLAVGSPQQEILARRLAMSAAQFDLCLCVGAAFDFLCGRQRRAPQAMSGLGLEWLFRLISNPRRLSGRYGRNLAFLLKLILSGKLWRNK